jgi:hypothetical protein
MLITNLQQALTIQEIVRAYGTAIHVATTLQPPPSPPSSRGRERVAESQSRRRVSALRQTAVRFIAWFG